jgi:hypothetical protein
MAAFPSLNDKASACWRIRSLSGVNVWQDGFVVAGATGSLEDPDETGFSATIVHIDGRQTNQSKRQRGFFCQPIYFGDIIARTDIFEFGHRAVWKTSDFQTPVGLFSCRPQPHEELVRDTQRPQRIVSR